MNITNDVITFVNADFAGASAKAVAAITLRAGPNYTPAQYMAKLLNDEIVSALQTKIDSEISSQFKDLVTATQNATPLQQSQIKGFANQARAVLGLTPIP